MALQPNSRYSITTDTFGRSISTEKDRIPTGYDVVVSVDGQTFEELATIHLGDPTLWWKIADINPRIKWPDNIPLNTRIRIPRC